MPKKYRCDIIVVTWNQLEYIKECVENILKHTDIKSRLIIVDNASREDTREYLRGVRGNGLVDVKLMFNGENLGPGKARNIALREMDADYVCFVDSDVTVTPGWLSAMINIAEVNADIGMVNASSNNFNQVPPPQMSLDEYARSLKTLKDEYLEVGHCISFCMLIKAEVVEKIGLIDEDYILAVYEDTDYSMKASAAGYKCVISRGAYVWHHGHRSTGKVKKMSAITEHNKERFYKKWGRPLRILWAPSLSAETELFEDALTSCVELARDGNYVYLIVNLQKPYTRRELFGRWGLVEHANVHFIERRGSRLNRWLCLWQVIKKRKKAYDLVISDDKTAIFIVKIFGILYKAKGFAYGDFEALLKTMHELKAKQ